MILMALDHTRDFFGDHTIDALDVAHASPGLFLSRWVTHLCAPTFVFLAGLSAALAQARLPPGPPERHRFCRTLALRGVFLIVAEATVIRCFGWYFNFDYRFMNAGVLFGVGGSMILLAGCIWLRRPLGELVGLGLLFAFGHPFLAALAGPEPWWTLLLRSDELRLAPDYRFYVSYPVLPWFGVMALGYVGGWVFQHRRDAAASRGQPAPEPSRALAPAGLCLLLVFTALRAGGLPVDPTPAPRSLSPGLWPSLAAFVNCEKYPPSPGFLLMTLGLSLLCWRLLTLLPEVGQRFLATFGRVPFFFYVVHLPLIHGLAVAIAWCRYGRAEWLYRGPVVMWSETLPGHPDGYGLGLGVVCGITGAVVLALYPACRGYGNYKATHRRWWLAYL